MSIITDLNNQPLFVIDIHIKANTETDIDFHRQIPSLDTSEARPLTQSSIIFSENPDILTSIIGHLGLIALHCISATSRNCRKATNNLLIHRLNRGEILLTNLGINNVKETIDFFGNEYCSKIINLDLRNFKDVSDQDLQKISQSFLKINYLFLRNASITDRCTLFFEKMTSLKSLDLSGCTKIQNLSFLVKYPLIERLNLSCCKQVDDISVLENCQSLKVLDLSFCWKINDFSLLASCTSLTHLNLSGAHVEDLNFLKNFSLLENLNLFWCYQIDDFSPLTNCKSIRSLCLCFCKLLDFDFLKNCPQLNPDHIIIEEKDLDSQHIAHIAWAVVTHELRECHIINKEVFERLAGVIIKKAQDFNTQEIVNITKAFSNLYFLNEELFGALERVALEKIKEFDCDQIAHLADAFTCAAFRSEKLRTALANVAIQKIEELSCSQIIRIAASMKNIDFSNETMLELFAAFANFVLKNAHSFNYQEITGIKRILETFEIDDEKLLSALDEILITLNQITDYTQSS